MSDPQPSAAAMRLIDAQDAAVREHLRSVNMQFGATLTHERERSIRTLALDNAGVGKAVDMLERISLSLACSDLKSWSHLIDEALAALTGEQHGR